MIEILQKLLRSQGGAFLDVGVNLGQTLVKVKALDAQRDYVGLEPNPSCVFYVSELIKENHFERCMVLPVGLYTRDCILPLLMFAKGQVDSAASVIQHFRAEQQIVSRRFVPVFSFESLEEQVGRRSIGICKIDVEGAELEVVNSLIQVIGRDRPIIVLEVLPVYSSENRFRMDRQAKLEKLFEEADFRLFRINKTTGGGYAGLQGIDHIGIHSDLRQCDYLVVPVEKCEKLFADR